jgi:uncharacterized membrane protein YdjX (TVP38/TMEM64 family)
MLSSGPVLSLQARRWRWVAAGVGVAVVLSVLGWMVWCHAADLFAYGRTGLAWVQAQGAGPFFAGMAVLPAVGVPALVFLLSAGPLYGRELGVSGLAAAVVGALAVNLALCYALARVLRPWIAGVCAWLGFKLPQARGDGSQAQFVAMVRLTPGVPFCVQSYLLALGGVRFGTYLGWSLLTAAPVQLALVFFGKALAQGKAKWALLAGSALVAVLLGVQLWRRRLAARLETADRKA